MLSTIIIKRSLNKDSSYYDQIKFYYETAHRSLKHKINKKGITEQEKSILQEKLNKAHKDCLDKLELNKEKINRDELFAKRFKEYPYEMIWGYTRECFCLNWDLVEKYDYEIYVKIEIDRIRVLNMLHLYKKSAEMYKPYQIEFEKKTFV